MDKREFIGSLGVLGAAGLGVGLLVSGKEGDSRHAHDQVPPTQGRGGDGFPQVKLFDHDGQAVRLFDDSFKEKIVLIHFMSIETLSTSETLSNLKEISSRIGDRLGRNTWIYTVSTEPDDESVDFLQQVHDQHKLSQGWRLLTGNWPDVHRLGNKLYKGHMHHGHAPKGIVASPSLIHYGYPETGLWGAFPVNSEPQFAADRVTWVEQALTVTPTLRRAGPKKLV